MNYVPYHATIIIFFVHFALPNFTGDFFPSDLTKFIFEIQFPCSALCKAAVFWLPCYYFSDIYCRRCIQSRVRLKHGRQQYHRSGFCSFCWLVDHCAHKTKFTTYYGIISLYAKLFHFQFSHCSGCFFTCFTKHDVVVVGFSSGCDFVCV